MAKSFKQNLARGKNVSELISDIDATLETKNAINELHEDSTPQEIVQTIEIIKDDKILADEKKVELINTIRSSYIEAFNFTNCPKDYQSLKREAKFLAGMTQYSFLLMAQRLEEIKDRELYKEDGYPDFKSFIDCEIKIQKSSVYNYIDIYNEFLPFFYNKPETDQEKSFEFSKLIPILPVLKKAQITQEEKAKLKKDFFQKAKNESFREIVQDVRQLKTKYGLTKNKKEEPDENNFDVRKKKYEEIAEYLTKHTPTNAGDVAILRILNDKIRNHIEKYEYLMDEIRK